MSRSANTTASCPACKKPNDQDMHFCIFCGTVLNQAKARRADRTCISCGRFDELNVNFCIFCGANTSQAVSSDSIDMVNLREKQATAPPRPPQSQSSTRNRVKAVKAQVVQEQIRAQQKTPAKSRGSIVWVASGALVGVIMAALAFQTGFLVQAAKFCLPSTGLAIYTEAPSMTVLIEDSKGKDFIIGQTGPTGTLAINDLNADEGYRLRMEGQGFETVYFPPFSINADNVSVLGYPKKVSLPSRHI